MTNDVFGGEDILDSYEPADDSDEESLEQMSFRDYVDWATENYNAPALGGPAEYLYRAIESKGTRTVIEQGEEVDRYIAFDDPYNDGEHAVFGNTELLNDFMSFLKKSAKKDKAKAPFIIGPTATGKSELMWNIEETVKEYSRSDDGRMYTLSVTSPEEVLRAPSGDMWKTYGAGPQSDVYEDTESQSRIESPIRIDPLSVLKELDRDARLDGEYGEFLEQQLNELRQDEENALRVQIPDRTDPTTKFLLDEFEDRYSDNGNGGDLLDVIDDYLEVKRVQIDRGEGLGTLNSGSGFSRFGPDMIGSYPMGVEPIPPNFSYSGALSLGSPVMVRMDDSDQYWQYLEKMNEILDRGETELPSGEPMPVETMPVFVANPDFAEEMARQKGLPIQPDPEDSTSERMRKTFQVLSNSTERRMAFMKQGYLTNYGYESELVRKMMGADWDLTQLYDVDDPEEALDITRRPMTVENEGTEYEFAPHAVEAGAMAEVITRLDPNVLPGKNEEKADQDDVGWGKGNVKEFPGDELSLMEKVELFQKGYVEREYKDSSVRLEKYDFNFDENHVEYGFDGIPVTQTIEVFEDLIEEELDWNETIEGIAVSQVRTAYHVLDALEERIPEITEVPESRREEFDELLGQVEDQITDRYNADVLNAALEDQFYPSRDAVNTYVEKLLSFRNDEPYRTDHGTEKEIDPIELQEEELQFFNFSEDDYTNGEPNTKDVKDFRDKVQTKVNRNLWDGRDEEMSLDEYLSRYDVREDIDHIRQRVGEFSWDGVEKMIQNGTFKPEEWDDKELLFTDASDLPSDDELAQIKDPTRQVKNKIIRNMVAEQDYTVPSAYVVSREIVNRKAT